MHVWIVRMRVRRGQPVKMVTVHASTSTEAVLKAMEKKPGWEVTEPPQRLGRV